MVASSHCSNMVFCVALRRESIMALCSPSVMESARAALLELWSLLVAFHHTNKCCQFGATPLGGIASWGRCQLGFANWALPVRHCQLGALPVGGIASWGHCQWALPIGLCQTGVAQLALPVRRCHLGLCQSGFASQALPAGLCQLRAWPVRGIASRGHCQSSWAEHECRA
jgi:hypothetical protein